MNRNSKTYGDGGDIWRSLSQPDTENTIRTASARLSFLFIIPITIIIIIS